MKVPRLIASSIIGLIVLSAGAIGRTEVPITQTLGANGRYFYFISISVGNSQPFKALLDTGSTGLRVLPGMVRNDDVNTTGRSSEYSYGSGSQFSGHIVRGIVAVGNARTAEPVGIMLIDKVGCRTDRPDCPAADRSAQDFSFASEGGMAEPNRARIGVGLALSDADNPLAKMGNGVWIVELPRPDEALPGRLILNPTPEEVASFTKLEVDTESGELSGCVIRVSDAQKICGSILPDTGGNGMVVEVRQRPESFPWSNDTQAVLGAVDRRGTKFGIGFSVKHVPGDPENLHWQRSGRVEPRISGSYPFLGYLVLFDSAHHQIGFKQR